MADAYVKVLKEDNGDIIYPQTVSTAVFTSNGSDVETEMGKYVTATDIVSTSALSPVVSTAMIQDEAVTTAKIDDGAVTKAKVDATTYNGGTEDGWAVSYLPNGKKMWNIKGTFTTSSYTVGPNSWGYASNIATLPTSVNSINDVYVMSWASPTGGSASTKFWVYNGVLVGGDRAFGIAAQELYGSGTITSGGHFSITLIEA